MLSVLSAACRSRLLLRSALLCSHVPFLSFPLPSSAPIDQRPLPAVAGLQPIQRRDLVSQSMLEVFTFHESHLVTDPKLVGIVAVATRFVLLGSPAQVRCSGQRMPCLTDRTVRVG